jgi:hypothetical protein
MNPREGLRGFGRSRFKRPERPGAAMPLLHSGHSKVRPAKPSGTRTVEPQMAQVRAGTRSLPEAMGKGWDYFTRVRRKSPPRSRARRGLRALGGGLLTPPHAGPKVSRQFLGHPMVRETCGQTQGGVGRLAPSAGTRARREDPRPARWPG